jgi:hypothetical protein
VNDSEVAARVRYEGDGWEVLHTGAPDFLLRRLRADGTYEYAFSEVKREDDEMSPEQEVWREALEAHGANFILVVEPQPCRGPPMEKPVLVPLTLKDYARLEKAAEQNQRALGRQAAIYVIAGLDGEKP